MKTLITEVMGVFRSFTIEVHMFTVEDFYDDLGDVDITGCIFGIFGFADSFYHTYGGAIDLIADHANNLGAEVLPKRLKIELSPDDDIVLCRKFAEMVCKY